MAEYSKTEFDIVGLGRGIAAMGKSIFQDRESPMRLSQMGSFPNFVRYLNPRQASGGRPPPRAREEPVSSSRSRAPW